MSDEAKRLEYLKKAENAEAIAARFSGGYGLKSWLETAREYREKAYALKTSGDPKSTGQAEQESQAANDDANLQRPSEHG